MQNGTIISDVIIKELYTRCVQAALHLLLGPRVTTNIYRSVFKYNKFTKYRFQYLDTFNSAIYATVNQSVRASVCLSVCLSVTLRYCVKTRERRGMGSSPSGRPASLVFWCQEWLMRDDPVQADFSAKSCTHFAS